METPSQRDPAATQEERGVVILAGSVTMKFGEYGEYWVVPLMAGQMPVVIVPGGERQVDSPPFAPPPPFPVLPFLSLRLRCPAHCAALVLRDGTLLVAQNRHPAGRGWAAARS